jgi:hypothetical protein
MVIPFSQHWIMQTRSYFTLKHKVKPMPNIVLKNDLARYEAQP